MLTTLYDIIITPTQVTLCGETLPTESTGEALLTELYRNYVGDYPKFFKMDTLSRLGFVASELLLNKEGNRFVEREDRAIIFANRTGSLKDDTDYNHTINDADNYYPSPALFVYTLPNIVTGEIAIRNHYYGETAFYLLDNEGPLDMLVETSIVKPTTSVLAGWIECPNKDAFICKLKIQRYE